MTVHQTVIFLAGTAGIENALVEILSRMQHRVSTRLECLPK
jgi:hypothetical protein